MSASDADDVGNSVISMVIHLDDGSLIKEELQATHADCPSTANGKTSICAASKKRNPR
jgi:hypothetical protein